MTQEEKIRLTRRKSYLKNRERILKKRKEYYILNREARLKYAKDNYVYGDYEKEYHKVYNANYYLKNKAIKND